MVIEVQRTMLTATRTCIPRTHQLPPLNTPRLLDIKGCSSTTSPTTTTPQRPAIPCVEIQCTGSSIRIRSNRRTPKHPIAPPMKPISRLSHGETTGEMAGYGIINRNHDYIVSFGNIVSLESREGAQLLRD